MACAASCWSYCSFPLVATPVVVAYGWLVLLGTQGMVNNVLLAAGMIDTPIKLVFREFTLVLGLVYVSALSWCWRSPRR